MPRRATGYVEIGCGQRPGEEMGTTRSHCPRLTMMTPTTATITPDRSSPGLPRTAPPTAHQGGGDKCATGVNKIRGRENLIIGTWNVNTLHATGKLQQLTHEMTRYHWNILGLCEVRWKGIGETTTDEGHKLYFSGRNDKHQHGVGFLVHKDIINCVLGCRPVSSRIITLRLRATPFNITVIQAYAPTSTYSDDEVEDFYEQLQEVIDQTHKKDILIVQGDWNAQVGKEVRKDWPDTCGGHSNEDTNDRGLRLLEFAKYNNLLLANTLGPHKASRRWTWHHPRGMHHSQIDYILVQKRFRSCINIARTRSFPGADIGSDHDLVMMTFRTRLKKTNKPKSTRLKFDLDKLKDPAVADSFKALIGGKFAPLLVLGEEELDLEQTIKTFNTAVLETANQAIGKHQRKKKPWVTTEILDMCDQRRELKSKKGTAEGRTQYRAVNNKIKRAMKKAKEDWIEQQCTEVEENLQKNNTKQAYQTIKDLTATKQGRVSTIQDDAGKCLTEEQDILTRWTEYCSELYSHQTKGDPEVLKCPSPTNTDTYPILREEVEAAVKSLKKGKAAGVDNIPAELIQVGGEAMIDALTIICNKIWQTGEWPTCWTQSLIITLPKKGNLQKCQNYRTISLISHPSKVMLRVLLNRLKPQAETIIAEEQAGFRAGRSTTEQIFNLRILCEKHLQHQQDLYHVFIDFKKAFDKVWHSALWATMRKYNINANLIKVIEHLYDHATSAVLLNGNTGEWFRTTVGVRQGCLLSPTLFNIFLERLMTDALEDHEGSVSIGGRNITNLRFADDIDGLAGTEDELATMVKSLDKTSQAYGMEINAEKTKLMTNNANGIKRNIEVEGQNLETVDSFKYLGAIISNEGSEREILARIAQSTAALTKLKTIWHDRNIALSSKIRLLRTLVISIFLYACESWTLDSKTQKRIDAHEMRCYRKILNISYKDHITNEEVRRRISTAIGAYDSLLSIVKKRKLTWYGHITRSTGLAKTILQGTVPGGRKRGRPKKKWEDNICEWTGLSFADSQRAAHDRRRWREIVRESSVVPLQSNQG